MTMQATAINAPRNAGWRTLTPVRGRGPILLLPAIALAVLAVVTALSYVWSIPIEHFTKDLAALTRVHPLISVISSLGAFMYVAATAICLFAWTVAARLPGTRPDFLLQGGLLSLYLAVDDFYMFHEFVLPRYLGLDEKVVYAALALAILAFLHAHRSRIMSLNPVLLMAALACFAVSVMSDVLGESLKSLMGSMQFLLEDGSKFIGISLWAAWFIAAALVVLSPPLVAQQAQPPAAP